ncbi:divergent polysaccharide deacetylase family protein [Maritalea sp.]|uniref:divergent polysaccharide deacetylase family protein n=1 Tax=Maritalea sp. TaxID=2003361 RepID=UPI003EF31657
MIDKLDKPLGRNRSKGSSYDGGAGRARLPGAQLAVALLILVVSAPIAWVWLVDSPDGGRPVADVEVNSVVDSNELARNLAIEEAAIDQQTDESDLNADNGTSNSDQLIISTDGLPDGEDTSEGSLARTDMLEQSQHGFIPQVSADGDRPVDVYKRASITKSSADGKPLIAVIVSGLGLSKDGSADAIDKLPDDFTLAFAPYGKDVAEVARRARQGGHEIMLQVPLEPFDYPQNDPGPQTLLVGQSTRTNLDRLYWLMSRMDSYIGIINHMGAKFTSSSNDFEPIMEEISIRGLAYFDDGTSNRSVARQLAQISGTAFAQSEIVLDNVPSRGRILEQLKKLEQRARDNGHAIGMASVLPISVTTLTQWANGLEEKGFILVPVSALLSENTGI